MMIDKETILFGLAIYGAALSTWNLYVALRKDRRAVRVSVGSKMPFNTGLPFDDKCFAHLEVTNLGQRPVNITTIGLEVPGGKWLHPGRSYPGMENTDLPITLTDGQSARLHYAYADIAEALKRGFGSKKTRVVPFAKDSVGNTHRGESWYIDPVEFARM